MLKLDAVLKVAIADQDDQDDVQLPERTDHW
jgi:hypothetical protein